MLHRMVLRRMQHNKQARMMIRFVASQSRATTRSADAVAQPSERNRSRLLQRFIIEGRRGHAAYSMVACRGACGWLAVRAIYSRSGE